MSGLRKSLRLFGMALLFATPLAAAITDSGSAPPISLAANANSFSYALTINTDNAPTDADLVAGVLVNPEHPALKVVPAIEVGDTKQDGKDWITPIAVSGPIPFGSSILPIYYQGRTVDSIHIVKNGMALESPPTTVQEKDQLLLVLQNPSGFRYTAVRARLRFKDRDVCNFSVERFPAHKAPSNAENSGGDCNEVSAWTEFEIPQYAGVSLRAVPLREWFIDENTGFSRAFKSKGTLTLRFFGDAAQASSQPGQSQPGQSQPSQPQLLQEQTIPLEVEFEPGTGSKTVDFFKVGFWLLIGAISSVMLRVAIPNYRRFRSMKEQLLEVRKTTRAISEEVDSMLRVQLRVERLSLDTMRKSEVVYSPGFSAVAQRVESGVATLRRRIDFVRRLDASLNRKRLLIIDELAPPTRVAAIDRYLTSASEELKSDQFREEDWVFIQHTLEAADKSLSNPSEEEKTAFETLLVQRWKSIGNHFGFKPAIGWTNIPQALLGMSVCFPDSTAMPLTADEDGSQWIKAIGVVRADLQITALELIREFEFLAPAQVTDHWMAAMTKLIPWLATPALENLNDARSLLRQLSEGVDALDIITALQNNGAQIELDPQSVGSGERVHLAVRFWKSNLNSAEARQKVICEWRFQAFEGMRQSGTPEVDLSTPGSKHSKIRAEHAPPGTRVGKFEASAQSESATETENGSEPGNPLVDAIVRKKAVSDALFYRERGWEIYHYFESVSKRCPLEVLFYFDGKPVMETNGTNQPLSYKYVIDLQVESAARRKTARRDLLTRSLSEALELFAVLLVPLCALAVSTADSGNSGHWWQLLGLGFGSDTIRNVLSGANNPQPPKQS